MLGKTWGKTWEFLPLCAPGGEEDAVLLLLFRGSAAFRRQGRTLPETKGGNACFAMENGGKVIAV